MGEGEVVDRPSNWKSTKVVNNKIVTRGSSGGLWFLGFIGTLVYFLHYHSGTLALVIVAIVKAIFWPAFLAYYVLQFMHI
jgi:hypothetical protein